MGVLPHHCEASVVELLNAARTRTSILQAAAKVPEDHDREDNRHDEKQYGDDGCSHSIVLTCAAFTWIFFCYRHDSRELLEDLDMTDSGCVCI